MNFRIILFIGILFASLANAACPGLVSLAALNKANPEAANPSYCTDWEKSSGVSGECVLNADAHLPINRGIRKYTVTARGEIVATVAWMLYESGNWTYNINHFPGNIGQGTRTMMSWTNVSKYAQSIHADAYTAAIGSVDVSAADNTTKTKVINLVLNNEDSFGAGFWYLKTQAPSYHNNPTALRDGSVEDFQAYVEQGIGTTWNAEREDIWTKVNSAIMF